jgi:hypothetical protein
VDTALNADVESLEINRRVAAILDEDFGFLELRIGGQYLYGFFAARSLA